VPESTGVEKRITQSRVVFFPPLPGVIFSHSRRVYKPKRRQYLEEEEEEPVLEDTDLEGLTKEEKLELLDFEERCGYFGHVQLLAIGLHQAGKTDPQLKQLIGGDWGKIKSISATTTDNSRTKIPTTNNRRFRMMSSVGDLGGF
jgi:hypothetical protein